MRIPIVALLILATLGFAVAASDLEQKLDLARAADDTQAQIELLRRWLDVHPKDSAAVEELVSLWLAVSDFDMAQQALNLAPSPDPGLVARTNAEVAWRRDENLPEALKLLRTRAAAAPKDRETRLLLAEYLALANERPEQIAVLDSLIAEESDFSLLLDRAAAKMAANDPRGALADFRKASAEGPDESLVQNARAGFERLEQSITETSALDKLPPTPSVHFEKGYWWLFGGLTNRSLAEAREGLSAWPGSAYGKILEARNLVAKGELDASIAKLERHVDVTAALEDAKGRKGILQSDETLAKKPGNLPALVNRASWLNYSAQYQLALDDIEAVLKVEPANIPALHLAVAINRRLGNLPATTAYAERLQNLKAPPEILADVYAGLAELALEQSKLPLALDFADRSIAAKPLPQVWKLKAACFTRLGQTSEAAEALKKAEKGSR